MEIILFTLGLSVGSFLNVLIDRLAKNESVIIGRSHCDYCQHQLAWYDLIPLASFVYLRNKCRYCQRKISRQYPLVELITAFIFIFTFQNMRFTPERIFMLIYQLALFSGLLVIFFSDFKYRIIPDQIIIFLLFITFIYQLFYYQDVIINHLITALSISLFFFILVLVTRGRGMGMGDVKYSFFMGWLLGYPAIMVSFYLSFLTGAVVSLILVSRGYKTMKSTIPFGPFLVLATVISYLHGDSLWLIFRKVLGI